MKSITRLQAEVLAQAAEIDALRRGIAHLHAYVASDKFASKIDASGRVVDLGGMVNVGDIMLRLRETVEAATDAYDSAWSSEVGPRVEASHTGWRCPVCHASFYLPGTAGNTESRAQERMRRHWIAVHKEN